jgi:hypothetical protein
LSLGGLARLGALPERLQVSPLSHSPAARAPAQASADHRQSIQAGEMQDLSPGVTPRLVQSLAMAQPAWPRRAELPMRTRV